MASLAKRLSVAIYAVFVTVYLLTMALLWISSDKVIIKEAEMTAEHTLESAILEVEKALDAIKEDTKDLRWDRVVDKNPRILASNFVSVPDTRYENLQWYSDPVSTGKPVWTEPYPNEEGTIVFAYGYPVLDPDGKVVSVAMCEVQLEWISDVIKKDKFKPYENAATTIVSKNGVMMATNLDNPLLRAGIDKVNPAGIEMIPGKDDMGTLRQNGKTVLFVYGAMDNGWSCIMLSSYDDVFAGAIKIRFMILVLSLLAFVLFFYITWHAIALTIKPLKVFSKAANTIAQGNFDVELPLPRHDDEVGKLRSAFVDMQHSLKNYINELKATTAAKQRIESELSIANKIQLNLLPGPFGTKEPVRISSLLLPAKEVGGDLYDYHMEGRDLMFSIGDVSGKGVPAALLMSSTQSAFRFNRDLGLSMDKCTARINRYLTTHNSESMFVTMFLGRLNLDSRKLEFCNAGHNRIVVCPPDGKPYFLEEKSNFVLGLMDDFHYEAESLQLSKGTSLLLYTDGVTEAEDSSKALYGDERLLAWAEKSLVGNDISEGALAESLLADVQSFTAGNEQNDDITILIIKL